MSTSQVAVLGRGRIEQIDASDQGLGRRGLTLTTFMLLAAYGALRWGTMLGNHPGGRLAGLLTLTLVIAWLGGALGAHRTELRGAAAVVILVAAVAMIPMSGFPLAWVLHLRIAALANAIGNGLSSLPGVIVPYGGAQWGTSAVIILGAGMLMLAGALALCTTRSRIGVPRLIAAALPLVVLAMVPSVLSAPRLAAVHGLILFVLLTALLFSERVAARRFAGGAAFVALASVAALAITPQIDSAKPWLDVKRIGAAGVTSRESFNWSQTYGPLNWPRDGTTVMAVQARFPSYWKAQDLDLFNGQGWTASAVGGASGLYGVRSANIARWTQRLTVRLQGMATRQIIAAGTASPPVRSGGLAVAPGSGSGTYIAQRPLRSGSSYQVDVYAPAPSHRQLSADAGSYPLADLAGEMQMLVPPSPHDPLGSEVTAPVQFAPYGEGSRIIGFSGLSSRAAQEMLDASAYAPALRLAQRLKAGTTTPYGYVRAVLRYLSHGYTYDQSPPTGRYPILTFLFDSHRGYCQQFAGAMALLLRMGGLPARVAAGFTTGVYDHQAHSYQVSDLNAHTWVEAWFPGYGWVTFDPTPAADPALGARSPLPATQTSASEPRVPHAAHQAAAPSRAAANTVRRHGKHRPSSSSGAPLVVVILVVLLGLLGLLALLAVVHSRRTRSTDGLVEELERAFARCGRPLAPGVTLAGLEHSFADTPQAAEYVRILSQARFAGRRALPTHDQRREVRRRLRRGLGLLGWLRALIALPPGRGLS